MKRTKFDRIAELKYGKGLPKQDRVKGKVPVYGSNGIVGFHNESLLKEDAIIIGRKGSVGEIMYASVQSWPIDTTYYITKHETSLDLRYLYYKLLTLKLNTMNTHAAVPGLNRNDVYILNIEIPDTMKEQSAIGKILSDLDSKIELLQEQNKTLEAIGQAIFKHWFIDFEFPCLPEHYKPINNDEFSGACKLDDMKSVCTYKSVGGVPVPEKDKYFVYVLLCNDGSFYIGQTQDIYRRWYEHKRGKGAKWTKANEPVKVIHYEEYTTRKEAVNREKELKTGFGRKWLKREYEKLLKQNDVSPVPKSNAEKAGSPAPKSQAEKAGSPAPKSQAEKAGSPAPNSRAEQAGSPAPKYSVEKAGSPAPKSLLRQAGKMLESKMGRIPKDWVISPLGDIFTTILGGTPSRSNKKYWDGDIAWINSGEINNFPIMHGTEMITSEGLKYSAAKMMPPKTVLLPFVITINKEVSVSILGINAAGNQSVLGIVPNESIPSEYLYYWIQSQKKKLYLSATGGAQQHINKGNVDNLLILLPSNIILKYYTSITKGYFDEIIANSKEMQYLSSIRDLLLPKLMSGQIRVPIGEK